MVSKYTKYRIRLVVNGWTVTPCKRYMGWDKDAIEFCKRVDEIPEILARLATDEYKDDEFELVE